MRFFSAFAGWVAKCDHCDGAIITTIDSKAGKVELCLEHTLLFAQKDMDWFEAHHQPGEDGEPVDHESEKLKQAHAQELIKARRAR